MLKSLVCLTLLLACASATVLRQQHHEEHLQAKANPLSAFREWVEKHRKPYMDDLREFERRFAIWLNNLEYVIEHNSKGKSHWLHLNNMADLTQEEYQQHYLGYKLSLKPEGAKPKPFMYASADVGKLPKEIDWRAKGAVTPVKNQEQCGSCWAFSTTGSVEGVNAIVTKDLVSLSEQELVDCDNKQDMGCSGGLMDFAFQFIIDNGGLDTEEDYKYVAVDQQCNVDKQNRKVVTIDGYEDVPQNNEIALKKAVAHQPVSVAIEADQREFQLYGGGVFNDTCGVELDHGVLVVGYGTDPEAGGYWIVKNSWGPEWGDGGYIKMATGVGKKGICGINMQPSYPIKKGPNPPAPPQHPPAPHPPPPPPATRATSAPRRTPAAACARSWATASPGAAARCPRPPAARTTSTAAPGSCQCATRLRAAACPPWARSRARCPGTPRPRPPSAPAAPHLRASPSSPGPRASTMQTVSSRSPWLPLKLACCAWTLVGSGTTCSIAGGVASVAGEQAA